MHRAGSTREQSGTFMHELGHVLGLGHGGDSGINLKPNYLSVMSYAFQLGIPTSSGSRIDYSRSALAKVRARRDADPDAIELASEGVELLRDVDALVWKADALRALGEVFVLLERPA